MQYINTWTRIHFRPAEIDTTSSGVLMTAVRVIKPTKWISRIHLKWLLSGPSPLGSPNKLALKSRKCWSTSPKSVIKQQAESRAPAEEELKGVFRHFDADGDGKISALDLRSYFGSIGEYMSHEDAQSVIGDFDFNGDELLDFEEFTKLVRKESRGGSGGGVEGDLKRAFEMFELMEKAGSGCITPRGLQRMLSRLGGEKSLEECVGMIRVFDVDGDGVLNFQEFQQMMA